MRFSRLLEGQSSSPGGGPIVFGQSAPVYVQYAPINIVVPSSAPPFVPIATSIIPAAPAGFQITILHLFAGYPVTGGVAFAVVLQSSLATSVCTGQMWIDGVPYNISNPLGIFACAPGEGLDVVVIPSQSGGGGVEGFLVYVVLPAPSS